MIRILLPLAQTIGRAGLLVLDLIWPLDTPTDRRNR